VAQAQRRKTNLGAPPSFYHPTVNSSSAILRLSVAVKKNKEAENLWATRPVASILGPS
jgi:hypothetical protein